jgi:hypothetical protein
VAGGISVIRKVRHRDTVDTAMRKIFRKSVFKVYPNPVSKGESIHLQLKKAGQYSVQLLDNSSRPIMVQDLFAANDNSVTDLTIPPSITAGIYYIRVIDEKEEKQYADKITVE